MEQIDSWTTYGRVSGNRISVDLPKEYDAQEVQIIIIPKRNASPQDKDGWKKDLLSISKWDISEDDIRMTSWSITEF